MKKVLLYLNLIIICAVSVGNYFYLTEGGLLLKGLCSGGFALMGLINLCFALKNKTEYPKFCILMAVGLVFAMLGDIVLGFDFIIGAGSFAIGHICYFIAYCMLERLKGIDVIVGAVIFAGAGSYVMFCPRLEFPETVMKYVCLVYALIISAMVGKAIGNFIRNKNIVTSMIFIGSLLFFVSDLMLVLDWFMGVGDIAGKLCMATYYPAECLLAISVCAIDIFENKSRN